MFNKAQGALAVLTEIGMLLIGVGIVAQVLFGKTVLWLNADIVGNLVGFIADLGNTGYIGLVVAAVLIWFYGRRRIG